MGITIHESAAQAVLQKWMATPSGVKAIHNYATGLQKGRWSTAYRDAIGQPHFHRRDWPLHQVLAFAWMHTAICHGDIVQVDIGLGSGPLRDSRRTENATELSVMPEPFVAWVDPDQNMADQDGILEWTGEIIADLAVMSERTPDHRPVTREFTVAPSSAPLEIGSTLPSRSMLHMIQEGALARWPYGSDGIRLFIWISEHPMSHLDAAPADPEPDGQLALFSG